MKDHVTIVFVDTGNAVARWGTRKNARDVVNEIAYAVQNETGYWFTNEFGYDQYLSALGVRRVIGVSEIEFEATQTKDGIELPSSMRTVPS